LAETVFPMMDEFIAGSVKNSLWHRKSVREDKCLITLGAALAAIRRKVRHRSDIV
jgi:hypothetical protein